MYKKKDLKFRTSRDSCNFIWETKDDKYYISTADVEEADFFAFVNTEHGWEQIHKGDSLDDCIEQINLHFISNG